MKNEQYFSIDIVEFLYSLNKYKTHYLIVGGEAVIYYGHARLTGDIDIFYGRSEKNIINLYSALNYFWSNDIPGIKNAKELNKEGFVFQFGVPPNRIDLLNSIENVIFDKAWKKREIVKINYRSKKFEVYYIGLDELIKNKKAAGRPKDKDDLKFLAKAKNRREDEL